MTAVVPGGNSNYASGYASFAAGYRARAKHNGTFVWNDRSLTSGNDSLLSTAENQFIVRAANGVGINGVPVGKGPSPQDGRQHESLRNADGGEVDIERIVELEAEAARRN